jgi:CRP-like cAMP-binding protein
VRHFSVGDDASERLGAIPLFDGLSVAELRMIGRLVDCLEADVDEVIMDQGRHGYEFVIIEEGEAEVLRDGVRVRLLGQGEFFGELAILGDGTPRTASVVATTPMRALTLTSHFLHQIREQIPLVRERIDQEAQERLARNASAGGSAES